MSSTANRAIGSKNRMFRQKFEPWMFQVRRCYEKYVDMWSSQAFLEEFHQRSSRQQMFFGIENPYVISTLETLEHFFNEVQQIFSVLCIIHLLFGLVIISTFVDEVNIILEGSTFRCCCLKNEKNRKKCEKRKKLTVKAKYGPKRVLVKFISLYEFLYNHLFSVTFFFEFLSKKRTKIKAFPCHSTFYKEFSLRHKDNRDTTWLLYFDKRMKEEKT